MTAPFAQQQFVLPPAPADWPGQSGQQAPADAWLDGYVRHFSASSLRMLKICPEQYRQRYILGRKERPGEALVMGSAVHDALAYSHTDKITSGVDRPVPEVVEFFHDQAWPQALEDDGGEDNVRWDNKPDEVRRDGERVTAAYHKIVSPRIQPVAVELKVDYVVHGSPVPVTGYIDVVEGGNTIDLKTGKQVQKKPDSNWRTQGSIYAAATGKPTHFHSLSRAKTPSIATPLEFEDMVVGTEQRDTIDQLVIHHVALLELLFAKHGPDEPWPTTGVFMDYKGGAACRFCGFRKWCVAWEHERVVPPLPTATEVGNA